jgi:choline dehydrogenase-like flavoprotein
MNMGTVTARPSRDEFDVIVVGSGAAGGMAAYKLSMSGAKVLMLESGRTYDPAAETPMFNHPEEAPLYAEATPDKPQGYFDATINGGWAVPGEPYTIAEGGRFKWWRARMLGGRTNHWGRLSLRFGPYDFQSYTRDGLGVDWPIGYDDLAPWYDAVESLIGVFGDAEGIENSPDSPAGILQPPPPMRAYERWLQMYLGRHHDVRVVPAHMAILTRPLGDRSACFYATDCMRGCNIKANFQSTTVLIPPAVQTGNLTVRTDAHVVEVSVDETGKADGVMYIERATGNLLKVRSRAIVLGASTCETARILLQSKSKYWREGLGNHSGHVGRHLLDTVKVGLSAQVPALEGLAPYNDEGVSLFHAYAPWWGYQGMRAGEYNFSKGYHLEFWGGRMQPGISDIGQLASLAAGRGGDLRETVRQLYGSVVYISASGEMLPNDQTYCDLDPEVRDQWGLPVLRFHWQHGPHDLETARHMRKTLSEFLAGMGGRILSDTSLPIESAIRAGGSVIHESGTCRMGADPEKSVLDPWGRLWNMPNVYVTDAASFPSNPDKNPTLTILALSMRSASHLASALAKAEI